MSFSAQVKRELCRLPIQKRCCAKAEAYGILLFCNSFHTGEIKIITESEALARRLPTLFWKAFRLELDSQIEGREGGKFLLSITAPEKLKTIFETYDQDPRGTLALHLNFGVLEEECCKVSFCRGAFLGGGSVTDPEKGYHLELVTAHYAVSRELPALLHEVGFEGKNAVRKSNYVTYFKQSEGIEDFLTALGAPVAAMDVMSAKVEKHLRNGVNRRVNCDAANLDKAVDAAQEHLAAIRRLEERGLLDSLPDKLRQTARLREENRSSTLTQLAELCSPPISKSALNHRLRKLVELSNA
ncbi:MAG: DNA-binding protein WhiA [Oscillospiraceae bacterium]